jgi:short-subunit dehydrogenase
MRQRLDDKIVLITGAARGIGAETARRAAARDARVSLVGLEADRLAALAGEIGERAVWFEADVTDQEAVDGAVAGTVAALGGIDVVVANAGVTNNGTVAISPPGALIRTIDVNLSGVVRTVSAALPHVVERRGYVCVIASAASFTMMPGMAAYMASKAGAEHFANSLRLEVAHKGVKVGSVHPSWIDTDMVRDQAADVKTFSDALERMPWPMNSTTSVEDCAEAILDGIERRKRRIYVPRSLALVQALRTVLTGPIADWVIEREAKTLIPELEAEITKLGRWFGGSSVATPPAPAAGPEAAEAERDGEPVPKLPT